jgi:hypothetical protein
VGRGGVGGRGEEEVYGVVLGLVRPQREREREGELGWRAVTGNAMSCRVLATVIALYKTCQLRELPPFVSIEKKKAACIDRRTWSVTTLRRRAGMPAEHETFL